MSKKHWLYREENRWKLWAGGGVVLMLTVLAQWVVDIHGHYDFEHWFGFAAFYGFMACTGMVLCAKLLGFLVKRRDSYYDD